MLAVLVIEMTDPIKFSAYFPPSHNLPADTVTSENYGDPLTTQTDIGSGSMGPAEQTAPLGPSFSCANPPKWAEQQVCASTALSEQDQRMAALYRGLLENLTGSDRLALRKSQRQWIVQRDNCINSANQGECLGAIYYSRIAALSEGPLAAEKSLMPQASQENPDGQSSESGFATVQRYDAQPQSSQPQEAKGGCTAPSSPAAVDGNSANADEMRAAHDLVVRFISDSDAYQACLLAHSPFPQSSAIQQRIKRNQRDKEQAGAAFNTAAQAFNARISH
jgi:uncharacterized protein